MKKRSLKKIVDLLNLEKEEIISRQQVVEIDIDGDEVDEIQANLLSSVSNQLSTRDAQKLNKIDLALKKIEEGAYGSCEDCGEEILEKRLEMNPYFSTCISCAEQREMDLKKEQLKRK